MLAGMDSVACINTLRRFFAVRGPTKLILNDCGTNFVGAINIAKTEKTNLFRKCAWLINTKASQHGGAWESQIKDFSNIKSYGSLQITMQDVSSVFWRKRKVESLIENTQNLHKRRKGTKDIPNSNSEHKVCIIGLDNAGKTTILYQYLLNETVQVIPTIGFNVEQIVWKNINFNMWDLGGQEKSITSWKDFYSNTEFVILVVDSTDRDRIKITKQELHNILNLKALNKAAILVFANKQDVKGCLSVSEITNHLDLPKLKKNKWHIQACCALSGEGLYPGLEWIANNIKKS